MKPKKAYLFTFLLDTPTETISGWSIITGRLAPSEAEAHKLILGYIQEHFPERLIDVGILVHLGQFSPKASFEPLELETLRALVKELEESQNEAVSRVHVSN